MLLKALLSIIYIAKFRGFGGFFPIAGFFGDGADFSLRFWTKLLRLDPLLLANTLASVC